MFRLLLVLCVSWLPLVVSANEDKLRKVGWSGYTTHFAMVSSHGVRVLKPAVVRRRPVDVPSTLYDRVKGGVSWGMLKLRREGDLCLSLRKRFHQCDLALTEDELLIFQRRHQGKLRMRFRLGLSE